MSTIFQERLLEAMQIKGMTQKDLAMRIGVTEAAVSKYLHWAEEPGGLQSMGSLRVGHD